MRTAQIVARSMGGDGQAYESPCGRSLDEKARTYGAEVERGDGQMVEGCDAPVDPSWRRYLFADGSAIVDCGYAWDIEGSTPWSWESEG